MKRNFLQELKEKIYNFFSENGFTCDVCGAEIFHYPEKRLCKNCEGVMRENDGRRCPKCGRKGLCVEIYAEKEVKNDE